MEVALEIVDALAVIFQWSIDTESVPADWRVANVFPLFKKGGREKIGNYRPFSLTSVVGKMLKSILKEEITTHSDSGRRISPSQHGFAKGRSRLRNLLEFFEDVTLEMDKG